MKTVVILDYDSKSMEGYKRMLNSVQGQFECKFFQMPEQAMEYVRSYPVAVLISELDMPVMSGKEVFDMVEMLSPLTVRIAMTQIKDVTRTLEIFNHARLFKLILKPFFLAEDIVNPIKEALKYHEALEKEESQRKKMEDELQRLNGIIRELSQRLEEKKWKHTGIYNVAVGVIKGNLNSEMKGMDAAASGYAAAACEELLQEFMRYYMYEEHGYQFYTEHLQKLFHLPREGCVFQIQNKTERPVPRELMPQIAYGMFLGGYLCQQLLISYRAIMLIETEKSDYVLRMFCQFSGKGEMYRIPDVKTRQAVREVIEEIAKALATDMVRGSRDQQFALKLYFRREDVLSD